MPDPLPWLPLLLVGACALALLALPWWARSAHPGGAGGRDPTYGALLGALLLLLGAVGMESWLHPPGRVGPVGWTGRALLVLGAALTVWARRALGASYAPTAHHPTPERHTLVDHGPYRWLRHPQYVGNALSLLGLCLALERRWALLALLPFALAVGWRVREEERYLRRRFSPQAPGSDPPLLE